MGIKSRQVAEFPKALDESITPYGLNEFTPSARSLSDLNNCSGEERSSASGAKVPVRMAKAVFVGDVGVGKTSIINRFCRGVFENNYRPTIGVDYEMERFWLLNVPFNLQIWDTAGQEKFNCIASSYYRGTSAVVTVFDASNMESLATCQKWMDDVVNANKIPPLKFLVATKMDLVNVNHKEKIHQMAIRMANLLGAEYWYVSSKSGENIEQFFRRISVLAFETALSNEVKENLSRQMLLQREPSILRPLQSFDEEDISNRVSGGCSSSCKS